MSHEAMMRYANTVAQLCPAIPFSRSEFYRLRKLAGAPRPRSDGRFAIAEWRRFFKRKRSQANPSEKEQVELDVLKLKKAKAEYELSEAMQTTYNTVRDDLLSSFVGVLHMVRAGIHRMHGELAPRLSGMDARSAYRLLRDRERVLFAEIYEQLRKRTGGEIQEENTRPTTVIVPFNRNGNGSVPTSARKAAGA